MVADPVPAPYRRQPEPTPAGVDPDIDAERVAALVGAALPKASGLTDAEIDDWQRRTGCRLTADVRALFRTADSGDLNVSTEDGHEVPVLRLERLDGPYEGWTPQARYGDWDEGCREVIGRDPEGRVQHLGFSPAWVVLGDDWGGNRFVSDLAPGPDGQIGQILLVTTEEPSLVHYLAPSLTAFLLDPEVDAEPVETDTEGLSVESLAEVTPSTEVLSLRTGGEPAALDGLADHPRLRTLEVAPGAATGVESIVGRLPALEHLGVDVATWRRLRDAGPLPPSVLVAGFTGSTDWPDAVAVANDLLARAGRPPIAVVTTVV